MRLLPAVMIVIGPWATGCGEVETPPPFPEREDLPRRALDIRMTGEDFKWIIRYPGEDGTLDTQDDFLAQRHLHLPAETEVSIELRSADYVYGVFVPELDLIEAAIPEKPFLIQFRTGPPGTLELLGSQMCGYSHPDLIGELVIHERADFDAWLSGPRD